MYVKPTLQHPQKRNALQAMIRWRDSWKQLRGINELDKLEQTNRWILIIYTDLLTPGHHDSPLMNCGDGNFIQSILVVGLRCLRCLLVTSFKPARWSCK